MHYKKTISGWDKILTSKLTLVILGVLLLVIGYSILNELKQQKVIQDEISSLSSEIKELENKNLELAQNLKHYQNPAFIEREAREKLNMAQPGEHAVIITGLNNNGKLKTGLDNQTDKKNYQLWFEYFLKAK